MEKHKKIIAPRRPYNHLGLKAGDVVIIDREFNNACTVTIVDIGPIGLFATVTDGSSAWDVMTYRLSRLTKDRVNSSQKTESHRTLADTEIKEIFNNGEPLCKQLHKEQQMWHDITTKDREE